MQTKKDIDVAYEAVKHANSPLIHTFISTSPLHMEYKLKMKPEDVLEKAARMVAYAKKKCSQVEFSAEDATRTDFEFLARVVEAVIASGATIVNLPDTVGYTTPAEMAKLISYLKNNVPNVDKAILSVHCHNDLGMGVANSLAGVEAGARQIECTINGLGERAGNAALEEIVMALNTRKDYYNLQTGIDATQIARSSKLVYSIIGMPVPLNKPIVGTNAFAHESGIHQHGILANTATYEIMSPESVGISKSKLVLGKHSGKHALKDRITSLGYTVTDEELEKYFEEFKNICDKKKTVTDNDIEAIITNELSQEYSFYKLGGFDISTSSKIKDSCAIFLEFNGTVIEEVALGDGPIDAAYNAIDKIIEAPPHTLDDYAIHSTSEGKDALGEVIVKIKSEDKIITGKGLSTNVIEASIMAYLNAVNKLIGMIEEEK